MQDTENAEQFEFIPEYSHCVANVANDWANLEYYINESIWILADVVPAFGACITSQLVSLTSRLTALLALLKVRKAPQKLIDQVNKFAEDARGPTELRNRIIHDMWLIDNRNPGQMGQMQVSAQKKLVFKIKERKLSEVQHERETIVQCRQKAWVIRKEIRAVLDSLPEIPQSEQAPIIEHHYQKQSPTTDGQ